MTERNSQKPIPKQNEGGHSDTSESVTFNNQQAAVKHFETVKQRLLNVSNWKEISGMLSADFELTDHTGQKVNRPAQKGDYFKIDIPAPGSKSGEGFDWVQIQQIGEEKDDQEDSEYLFIKVSPAQNPQTIDQDVAHFFKDEASSTFLVKRVGQTITAEVHGRNEVPNTEAEDMVDKIRNTLVAIGAILGFSKSQWKSLVKGLVEKEDQE